MFPSHDQEGHYQQVNINTDYIASIECAAENGAIIRFATGRSTRTKESKTLLLARIKSCD